MKDQQEMTPVPGHEAFARSDPAATCSQAAFLLTLGRQPTRRIPPLSSDFSTEKSKMEWDDSVDPEDAEALALPDLGEAAFDDAILRSRDLHGLAVGFGDADGWRTGMAEGRVAELALALYKDPSGETAVRLIRGCMYSRQPLVRVAAAAADLRLHLRGQQLLEADRSLETGSIHGAESSVRIGEPGSAVEVPGRENTLKRTMVPTGTMEVLMRGVGAQEELVRDVAVSALESARSQFDDAEPPVPSAGDHGETNVTGPRRLHRISTVVHGTTFGRATHWWRPGRVFPQYLKANVRNNLYSGSRPFSWSGLYNDWARDLGARDLLDWASGVELDRVFAYSHGGSVAMLASGFGLGMRKLVLLSCPVHRRYAPDFQSIGKVVSVRTRLDLVILADRGGQRFRDGRIQENTLPVWFSHKATRKIAVWQRYNIGGML